MTEKNKIFIVTRHSGSVPVISDMLSLDSEPVVKSHWTAEDTDSLQPGDVVVGIMPIHIVAQICAKGGRFFNFTLNLPPELRGKELSREQIEDLNPQLQEFFVEAR